jgi:anti-sigma B factor antagonist
MARRRPSEERVRRDLLEIGVEREDSLARIVPKGEIDMATAPDLEAAIRGLASDSGVRRVLVDLAGVTFLDSSGLHVLCKATNAAQLDGFDFGVMRPPDHIRRLFAVSGVNQIVSVLDR